jgi:SpoVK/Ycf46/Vps4 family AAA+-type ATPase
MAKNIYVGEGPAEIKLEEIFNQATSGDNVILNQVDRFHTVPSGMNIQEGSTLHFTGNSADRVVKLSCGITVYGELTLENVTLDFSLTGVEAGERIYIPGGTLNLNNVTIIGSDRTISPILVDYSGTINIDDTEVLNRADNGYGIDVQGDSKADITTSYTNGVNLDHSLMTVTDASILGGVQLKNDAELSGVRTRFNFTESVNPRNIMCTDSKMKLLKCDIKGDKTDNPFRAFNATLDLEELTIQQVRANGFGLEVSDNSTVTIKASEINGLFIKSSIVSAYQKFVISGFFEMYENAVFKAEQVNNKIESLKFALVMNTHSNAEITYFDTDNLANFKVIDSSLRIERSNLSAEKTAVAEVAGRSEIVGDFIESREYERKDKSSTENLSVSNKKESEENALESLDQLVGLEEVKRTARKFINLTNVNKKKEEAGIPVKKASLHSVFLGNPGTGKTTVARLIGQILSQNGVLQNDHFVEVSRQDLVSGYIGKTTENTLEKLKEAHGGVFFVDEAYTLNSTEGTANYGQEALDTILKYMEDYRDEIMIIFAGYTKEMFDFMNMNPGLKSRVPHSFDFEDYTIDQLVDIGVRDLEHQHYNFDQERYRRELSKAYRRSTENSNARFVRNFNEKLVIEQSNRVEEAGLTEKEEFLTVTDEDWDNLLGNNESEDQKELNELLNELNQLVGLRNVKTYVNQLVKEARANQLFEERGISFEQPSYHMIFAGPPGTGKTTVARLISKIYFALGILSKEMPVEVDRGDLVGSYIGHSEKNTNNALERAMGGVLFIDEAYQLTLNDSDRDFGRQVVDTLITALENHRDQFIAIFAGYTGDMERFLEANEGLKSRIPYYIEFDAYTPEDVGEIVIRSLGDKWRFNEDFLRMTVINKYDNLPENEKSNGRWARNFTQKLLMLQKNYIVSEDVSPENFDFITDKVIYEIGQMAV